MFLTMIFLRNLVKLDKSVQPTVYIIALIKFNNLTF